MADIFSFDDDSGSNHEIPSTTSASVRMGFAGLLNHFKDLKIGKNTSTDHEYEANEVHDKLSDLPQSDIFARRRSSVTHVSLPKLSTPINIVPSNGSTYGIDREYDNQYANTLDSPSSVSSRLETSYEISIERVATHPTVDEPYKPCPSDFEEIKVLGCGAYGKVLLVREISTGRLYAQKQLKKASMVVAAKNVERTKNERFILEAVRHHNIVKLIYAFQDNAKVYLILEYLEGGELFTHLAQTRALSEKNASFYVAEMILALVHLHTKIGVVYRDLKPENCMLDREGHLVLTDFGLSKIAAEGEKCNTFTGTAQYMAPEIIQGRPYDYAADWWSLGCVCFDMITGSPPFPGNNTKKICEKILKQKPKFPYYLTADAKDLLIRLLRKDPNKRLGDKDIDKIKKHRFFRFIDWDLLEHRSDKLTPPIIPVITDPVLAENFDSEFTEMSLSPVTSVSSYDHSGSCAINIKGEKKDEDIMFFQGFSYTASQSFKEKLCL